MVNSSNKINLQDLGTLFRNSFFLCFFFLLRRKNESNYNILRGRVQCNLMGNSKKLLHFNECRRSSFTSARRQKFIYQGKEGRTPSSSWWEIKFNIEYDRFDGFLTEKMTHFVLNDCNWPRCMMVKIRSERFYLVVYKLSN